MELGKIEKMQAARRQRLGDKSPRQVGEEKTRVALLWIYRWGWSSPKVVSLIGQDERNGLAARLVRNGLLTKTRTESGGCARDVPAYVLTLTEAGVQEVERFFCDDSHLLPYAIDPYRINQAMLRHDHLAQTATAKALISNSITSYQTEKELRQRSENGVKQPDVAWLEGSNRIAVEIELSAKWGRDLDQFVHSCILALAAGQNRAPPRFSSILLASDSKAIITRYQKAFASGTTYWLWAKDINRHWQRTHPQQVPAWVEERMTWKFVICR